MSRIWLDLTAFSESNLEALVFGGLRPPTSSKGCGSRQGIRPRDPLVSSSPQKVPGMLSLAQSADSQTASPPRRSEAPNRLVGPHFWFGDRGPQRAGLPEAGSPPCSPRFCLRREPQMLRGNNPRRPGLFSLATAILGGRRQSQRRINSAL